MPELVRACNVCMPELVRNARVVRMHPELVRNVCACQS